ncbi:MAG TPA: hypothetical protein VFQ35_21015 [Polyangiaceae bacterium]|nr:hypothetical protein [Polyangiaceae bacterium]
MNDDELPSRPRVSLDELALFERLRERARRDRAPAHLASQILDRVRDDARRERMLQSSNAAPERPRGVRRAVVLAGLLGVAASVALLAVHATAPPPISREAPARAAGSERASALAAGSERASAQTGAKPAPDPCAQGLFAAGSEPLIDDFEDGDDAVLANEQRRGFWRWVRETDAPGTAPALLPIPRPVTGTGLLPGAALARAAGHNSLALHVAGGRLSDWGAAIEFSFRPGCYDASRYAGIAFSARGPGRIYVAPREVSVIPIAEGGTCERECHNPHVQKVDLDPQFKNYEVRFEEVRQRGIGKPPLDTKRLNSLAFLIRPEDTPYDVWLDDVRFITR